MLETKYYKDFRHNYVILKDMESEANSYQCRMITENRISGLLSCQKRHINGEALFYYDISSKQSLISFCESGYVTMTFLERLLRQLQMVRESMSDYLLTGSCLLLKPEFVFMDVESGEFSFIYFPFETDENYMVAFMEYLTDRVDTQDREAVDVSYKILQLMEREQFVLDEVLQWFEEDYVVAKENCSKEEAVQTELNEWEEEGENEKEECTEFEKVSFINEKSVIGMMCVALGAGVLLFYVYKNYSLSQRAGIYFYAVVAADIILFLACGLYLLFKRIVQGKIRGATTLKDDGNKYREREDNKLYQDISTFDSFRENEKAEYGNTVFIPWVENCENKLYGSGKGNKHHIDLSRLPLTVGKLAGSVDMVIADQSISRRHVKFSREGNRICMTDLNSTNGTFKNGLRLEPNTSEILEPGDEIRLGKLKFIYR